MTWLQTTLKQTLDNIKITITQNEDNVTKEWNSIQHIKV